MDLYQKLIDDLDEKKSNKEKENKEQIKKQILSENDWNYHKPYLKIQEHFTKTLSLHFDKYVSNQYATWYINEILQDIKSLSNTNITCTRVYHFDRLDLDQTKSDFKYWKFDVKMTKNEKYNPLKNNNLNWYEFK
jgi:hypothetical protein